jgi:hypothetical protein
MTEEKNNGGRTVAHRALEYGWKTATIVLTVWTIVGLPSIRELVQNGSLSTIGAAVALGVPAVLAVSGLARWSCAWWVKKVKAPPLARSRRGGPAGEAGEMAAGPGEHQRPEVAQEESVREIARLSTNASLVLYRLLEAYQRHHSQPVTISLWPPGALGRLSLEPRTLSAACTELVDDGHLTEWHLEEGGEWLTAVLADRRRLADTQALRLFVESLENQLIVGGLWPRDDGVVLL